MVKIPSPQGCGLPPHLTKWRSSQEEAISVMITSSKRAPTICAPTGSGKSAMVVAAALLSKKPTAIVTNSRGLQDQYQDEFASIGMVDLRGRSNYECAGRADCSCEDGYNSSCMYKGTVACPSTQAEMRASLSNLVVTNYDKWCATKMYGTGLSHIQQVIFDEAHDAPDALARNLQVTLHHKEIEDTLKIPFPPGLQAESFESWKYWAQAARVIAEAESMKARARITGVSNPKTSWIRHYTHMQNLTRRLGILSCAAINNWVVDQIEDGYQFDPVSTGRYAESTLLLRVPKVIVVSATVQPKTLAMIGLSRDNYEFKEFDSDFDPADCPVYYVPTCFVDSRHPDQSMLWVRHDQIAARRQNKKAIVHTISYGRRDEVLKSSRFSGSMLINERGEAPSHIIDQFRNSGPGTILVSPSIGTGYNFPGDQCEWQFVCKVPFDPPSKVLKAREQLDKEYRGYRALHKMVQMFGRGPRFKGDRCEGFIGDDNMEWFWKRFGFHAPKSFRKVYKQVNILPPPLEKL